MHRTTDSCQSPAFTRNTGGSLNSAQGQFNETLHEAGRTLCAYHKQRTTCLSPNGLSECSRRWQARSVWSAAACRRFACIHKLRACPHTAPFDRAADPDGFSRAPSDAPGVGKREAFGVRRLAAALFLCPNNVPVLISHIPHQPDDRSYDPFRSRKSGPPNIHRLGAGKNARAPARGGKNTDGRERGRPRPHQRDNRSYDLFQFRRSGHRTYTGWGRARMPALLHAVEQTPAVGSAAVLGRINVTTDPTTCFNPADRATEHTPAGGGQECPRSRTRWKRQRRRERGRPRPHQHDNRSCTRFDQANPPGEHSREPQVHPPGMNLAFGPTITAMPRVFLNKYAVKYNEAHVWD